MDILSMPTWLSGVISVLVVVLIVRLVALLIRKTG